MRPLTALHLPWLNSHLFGKYLVVLVLLVGGAVLTTGIVGIYFSYQESERAATELQREKALAAASSIEQFIREIEQQTHWVIPPPVTGAADNERRLGDYRRLLREALAVTEVRYLDPSGREQVLVTRLGIDVRGSGADYSAEPAFRETRSGSTYFGPLYFRGNSEPYMTIATPETPVGNGVTGGCSTFHVPNKFSSLSRISTALKSPYTASMTFLGKSSRRVIVRVRALRSIASTSASWGQNSLRNRCTDRGRNDPILRMCSP